MKGVLKRKKLVTYMLVYLQAHLKETLLFSFKDLALIGYDL